MVKKPSHYNGHLIVVILQIQCERNTAGLNFQDKELNLAVYVICMI